MKIHVLLLAAIVVFCLASAHDSTAPEHDHWDLVIGAIVSIAIAYLGDRRVHRVRNETALPRLRVNLRQIDVAPEGPTKNPFPKS